MFKEKKRRQVILPLQHRKTKLEFTKRRIKDVKTHLNLCNVPPGNNRPRGHNVLHENKSPNRRPTSS